MNDKESAQNVIEAYRKRQQAAQKAPLILGAAALLLIVGAGALIYWLISPGRPAISLFPSQTPTPTLTYTPTETSTPTATASVTPTDEPTATETATPTISGPFVYQVLEGDTLFGIAAKFKVDLLLLITVNNLDPANPIIHVGDKLNIPGPDDKLPSATPLPANIRSGTKIKYKVQAGNSMGSIALSFNSTVNSLKKENKIENENEIFVGQVITVLVNLVTPVPTKTTGPTATAGTPGGTAIPATPAPSNTPVQ